MERFCDGSMLESVKERIYHTAVLRPVNYLMYPGEAGPIALKTLGED